MSNSKKIDFKENNYFCKDCKSLFDTYKEIKAKSINKVQINKCIVVCPYCYSENTIHKYTTGFKKIIKKDITLKGYKHTFVNSYDINAKLSSISSSIFKKNYTYTNYLIILILSSIIVFCIWYILIGKQFISFFES